MGVPVVVPAHTDPELAYARDYRGHPEGITTSTSAVISFYGRDIPIGVTLSLVPWHLRAFQIRPLVYPADSAILIDLTLMYAPSLDQSGELRPFTPLRLSELSQTLMGCSMGTGDITIDPRDSEYAPSLGDFVLIAPRNAIPRPEVRYDQPPGHDDTLAEPIPDCPAPAIAYPGETLYPPPFNQVPGAYSSYRDPVSSTLSHPSPSPLLSSGIVLPSPAYQNERSGLSTRLGQTAVQTDTLTLSTTAVPMRGVGVDRHPGCYEYQPSGHGDAIQGPIPEYPPTAVTALPGVAVYPGYLFSGHPPLYSPVHSSIVFPAHPAHQNEGNELSTTQQLLVQTDQDTPTSSATAGLIGGVVDQHPSQHQCTECYATYKGSSALNRHYKDTHLPRIACDFCGLKFPLGRRYLFIQHMERHRPDP